MKLKQQFSHHLKTVKFAHCSKYKAVARSVCEERQIIQSGNAALKVKASMGSGSRARAGPFEIVARTEQITAPTTGTLMALPVPSRHSLEYWGKGCEKQMSDRQNAIQQTLVY